MYTVLSLYGRELTNTHGMHMYTHTHTVNWLNPDKSLREQGITETAILTLRKKFFFSDQNVDRNDPIQLNLLYVQVIGGGGEGGGEEVCSE